MYNEQKQKLDGSSINKRVLEDINYDNNNQDCYQLFQQRKLMCEALGCNIIASTELRISIGFDEKQVFFFCKNCISKFQMVK